MRNTILGIAAVVIIAAAAYVFFSGQAIAPIQPVPVAQPRLSDTTPIQESNRVVASQQTAGTTVVVQTIVMDHSGFVAIHTDVDGAPGPVIGVSTLQSAGEHSNIPVTVSPALEAGKNYYAMLHIDNGDGVYQFPGPDAPVKDSAGNIVMEKFGVVTAPAAAAPKQPLAVAPTPTTPATGITAGTSLNVQATLDLNMKSGNFFFEPSHLDLKLGQPVTLHFTNSGFHTFTIDELGVNQQLTSETPTVSFTPNKKGTFEFYCAIGNHRAMGMKGTVTVD